MILRDRRKSVEQLVAVAGREVANPDAQTSPGLLREAALEMRAGMLGIADDRDAAQSWHNFAQQLEALAVHFDRHEGQAGHVAAWAGETLGKPRRDRVCAKAVHDRKLHAVDFEGSGALRDEHINRDASELLSKLRHALDRIVRVTVFDRKIAALDIAESGQAAAECIDVGGPGSPPVARPPNRSAGSARGFAPQP